MIQPIGVTEELAFLERAKYLTFFDRQLIISFATSLQFISH